MRCGRLQPPLPRGVRTCAYCAAPLPQQRWRADTPDVPAARPRARVAAAAPYVGPPSYGSRHPRWGFPTVIWRAATIADSATERSAAIPARALRLAVALCLCTTAAAATAAGAETWRYVLLLRGRTQVLSGSLVSASDLLVDGAALLSTVLAVCTAVAVVPLLVRLHAHAALRVGLTPGRPAASVLARLVVPGWNVHGVGVVTGEIDGLLSQPDAARPRPSRLVWWLWGAWVVDAVLVVIALARAFGRSEQSMADTVELHILVDLVGALVAALWALLLLRYRRLLGGPRSEIPTGWVVRPPDPTRNPAAATGSARNSPQRPAGES